MTKRVIGRVVLGVWLGCFTAAAGQLPPEIQVDKLLLQAKMLSEEKDHKGALEAVDRIVALQKEHGLTLPEAFPFQYAQTAFAAGSVQATIDSANRYLTAAGREGKYYREALELLVKAERKLQEPAVDRVSSTPVKPDLEPQPQAVPPSSPWEVFRDLDNALALVPEVVEISPEPQAQKTTAAQPMVDCRKWNTKKFFRKATVEDVTACVNAGAALDARDGGLLSDCPKCTPLHRAVLHNENVEVVKALLKGGADPNARVKWKYTPLHQAAVYNENPAVVKALIDAGAALDVQTLHSESTPLHLAAQYNDNPEVVKALIDAGAALTAWNKKDKTPLKVARRRHRKVLRNAWANLDERQKATHQARARRKKATAGPSFLDFAVGTAGGVAIAAAGGGTEESVAAGTVFAEGVISGQSPVGSPGGGVSAASANPGGSSGDFGEALGNLENSCGERFRSAFSEQNHGRFYCLDAFARHCALKKGHNQQQLDALRHDFEVLRSQGQESRCPYFGVFGVTYAPGFEREAIDRAKKETKKAQEERQRRLDEQARQAAQEGKRRVEENNARVLASDCDCISKDERDSELTCLDGFVGLTESHCNVRFRRR